MKLTGKIIKGSDIIKMTVVEKTDEGKEFRELLEDCLFTVCRDLDIQVPLWLDKNTKEFSAFRRTFFPSEQFIESVKFDKFEIILE